MTSAGTRLTAGWVLAGGASRRMGSNKALLRCSETTLIEHVSNQVRTAAGSAHVVGRRSVLAGMPLDIVEDLFPGEGPLGGIITALTFSTARWNLVVACDMPAVTGDWLSDLLQQARNRDCDALVPVSGDGREHPLCGVYRAGALGPLRTAWDTGTRGAVQALRFIRTDYLASDDNRQLTNVNTPADWDGFRSTIS